VLLSVQAATLDGCEAFRSKASLSVAGGILQAVTVVAGGYLGGVGGALWGLAAATGAHLSRRAAGSARRMGRARHRFRSRGRLARMENPREFSAPTFLIQASIFPVLWVINVMVANQDDGYAQLGILSAASQWQGAVLALAGTAGGGWFP
jgi:hypothetical protein